jgi:hypothetical protein
MPRDSEKTPCQLQTLARSQSVHVQRCADCGTLSLHMGAVTLRFAPAALESVWSTLGEALLVLHRELDPEPAVLGNVRARGTA